MSEMEEKEKTAGSVANNSPVQPGQPEEKTIPKRRGRPRKTPEVKDGKPETIGDIAAKYPVVNTPLATNNRGWSTSYDMTLTTDEIIARDLDRHMEVMTLPRVDTNDAKKVQGRYVEYFSICRKYGKRPTVAGFAESLGVSRQTLWKWLTGEREKPKEVVEVLEMVYAAINAELEDLLVTNKINPVSGIFLLKQSGYKDVQDVVVRTDQAAGKTDEELEEEYLKSIPVIDD